MKLASLKAGGRDGTLLVVSRDLSRCVVAAGIAPCLRLAIEEWEASAPRLQALSHRLNAGAAGDAFPFDPRRLAAPLPRAFQWLDGSAYPSHAELLRRARNAEPPATLYTDPMMYQGGSDSFLGPTDDILVADAAWGVDLEAEIAAITDDVPMGVAAASAGAHIQLLTLANDVSLRNLMPAELAKGFGFVVSKPSTAFAPVAVTPDELGDAWDGAKLSLPLESRVNGALLGRPNAGVDLAFDFPRLIAHAATSRALRAGTTIGSGTVSNRDPAAGSSCLQEKRARELIADGTMRTPLLGFGDVVRIEMFDRGGRSIFGAIEQRVARYAAGGRTGATSA